MAKYDGLDAQELRQLLVERDAENNELTKKNDKLWRQKLKSAQQQAFGYHVMSLEQTRIGELETQVEFYKGHLESHTSIRTIKAHASTSSGSMSATSTTCSSRSTPGFWKSSPNPAVTRRRVFQSP